MNVIQQFIKTRPYLVWSTKEYDKLSDRAIVESVLNYGDWRDYLFLEKTLGIDKLSGLFNELKDQKRTNLRPQVINYFPKYFNAYT